MTSEPNVTGAYWVDSNDPDAVWAHYHPPTPEERLLEADHRQLSATLAYRTRTGASVEQARAALDPANGIAARRPAPARSVVPAPSPDDLRLSLAAADAALREFSDDE